MGDPYEKEMRDLQRKEDHAREKARGGKGDWGDYHKASQEKAGLMRDQWSAIAARENLKR